LFTRKSEAYLFALLLGAYALLAAACGFAQTSVSVADLPRFDTLHEAVMYNAYRLEACSHYYECSGFIMVDPKGQFVVAPVRTDYQSDHVRIKDDTGPDGWVVAADFHSHPCLPRHFPGLFSPQDMISAITTRTIMYMVDLCTGDVHEFIPGVTKPDDVAVEDIWLSAGKVVGKALAFPFQPVASEGV
jgi:hypothetical protein